MMYFGCLLFPVACLAFALGGLRSDAIEDRGEAPKPKFEIARFLRTAAMVEVKPCEQGG